MSNFHVGQKVVCVRDGWNVNTDIATAYPRAGENYVIRSVQPASDGGAGSAIRLHWVINPITPGFGTEPTFGTVGLDGILNFRPVIERKTDISIFTKILDDARTKEPVGALSPPVRVEDRK